MATSRQLFALCAAASVGGCSINVTSPDGRLDAEASESFSARVEAAASDRLRLEGINGTVTIAGTRSSGLARIGATVTVRSDSWSDARDFLQRVGVEVEEGPGEIVVRTVQPARTEGRQVVVDYDLVIPAHLDVSVVNVNGDVELRSLAGFVDVDHVNGAVSVFGSVDDVRVTLVNGDIVCDADAVPRGGRVELGVVNGGIALEIPASTSALLEADVATGSISVQGLTILDGLTSAARVRGRLGAGDGLIDLDVVNGTIAVRGR